MMAYWIKTVEITCTKVGWETELGDSLKKRNYMLDGQGFALLLLPSAAKTSLLIKQVWTF